MRFALIALILFGATPVFALNRSATEADCKLLTSSYNIPCVIGVTPFDPDNPYFGDKAATAKAFLKSLPKQWAGGSTYDCKTYEDKNIDKLNPQFAICMADFLRAYTGQYGQQSVRITSAYRSYDEQKCVCVGEKGLCGEALPVDSTGRPIGGLGVGHQYGTAMDIHPNNGDYQGFHNFAVNYGVWFRLGMKDRPHVEPRTQACGLGMSVPPPGYAGPATGAPTSQLSNLLRSTLGVPTQPIPFRPTPLPLPTTQSPLIGFEPPPLQTTTANTNTNVDTNSNTSIAAATTSIADLLRQLLSTSTTTATTTRVNVGSSTSLIPRATTTPAGTPLWYPSIIAQHTFTSEDLSWRRTPVVDTPLQRTLAEFKAILLSILPYLQPFYSTPNTGTINAN